MSTLCWRCTAACRVSLVLLVTSGVFLGCAPWRANSQGLERGGIRYGVTQGTFRGRWWNYYERGCSYLEGGFYEEAGTDLAVAIQGRAADQLWPRTYGLHFLPEYFPNREYGVVRFHQNRFQESLAYLERSLGQCFSARAAYYLDEVRRQLLHAEGRDSTPPAIEILAPASGVLVGTTEVEVRGIARDDTYVDGIEVDGHALDVKVSEPCLPFSHIVSLRPGQTTLRIAAVDLTGKESVLEWMIQADVDGPVVSFDAPVAIPGPVQGLAFDPAGIQSMRIAGKAAVLRPGEGGAQLFAVELSPQDLTPPVRYECADTLGNTTRGTLPLDVLLVTEAPPMIIPAGGMGTSLSLGNGLRALVWNGRVVAVAVDPVLSGDEGVRLSLSNLEDGQQYFMDEIVVALDISGQHPIESLQLNGEPLPLISGRHSFRVSRKIRLQEGDNPVSAQAVDDHGATATDLKTIERARSAVEMNKAKLAVAFLGGVFNSADPQTSADAEYILNELSTSQAVQKRFTIVDRALLKEILAEQNLSEALASKSAKLALGKLVPAELMIAARIDRDQETISIALEGSSSETAVRVLPRVDVAGPYKELDRLIEDLGIRLVQELPRPQGQVLQWESPEITLDLNARQGVRNALKCLVFRTEDVVNPNTGELLGQKPVVVCEGLINDVSEQFSTAEALAAEGMPDVSALPIQAGHYVILK